MSKAIPPDVETRTLPLDRAELRVDEEGGKFYVSGYAAVFNSLSEDLGGFRERIKAGAFKRSLAEGLDVVFVADHDYRSDRVLARSKGGRLKLSENDTGLRIRAELPATQLGRDLVEQIKVGNVGKMSFAFKLRAPESERWIEEAGVIIREIDDLELIDVSVVLFPAYPATSISVAKRALDQVEAIKAKGRGTPAGIARRRIELAEQGAW